MRRWLAWLLVLSALPSAGAQERRLPPVPPPRPVSSARAERPDAWAASLGWPSWLAPPELESVSIAGVLVERRRLRDGTVERRARGSGDGPEIWRRWAAAVRGAGRVLENERIGPASASATVCEHDCTAGPRYFAVLAWDSWVWLTLREPGARRRARPGRAWRSRRTAGASAGRRTTAAPSAASATRRASMSTSTATDRPTRSCRFPAVAWRRSRAPPDVEWELYVTRGACGHHVGRLRGDLDRWRQGADTSSGWLVLDTLIEASSAHDEATSSRWAFRGGRYREIARTVHPSRCDIHPEDCRGGGGPRACAVRGHPTIVAPFDARAAQVALHDATQAAQRECTVETPVRCSVDLELAPEGVARGVQVSCGAASACVTRVMRAVTVPVFAGEAQTLGISFQITPAGRE
ncbi:MAG: hypothetical protein M5U28_11500 [Sandaracinaceae bacterium]|nr:hypothetical protein [Sandaracinaceae bacterium]